MIVKENVMSKIGLIDADLIDHGTRHPNLAIMKIAGYYRDKGDEVKLIYSDYNEVYNDFDKVYISKVFTFSKVPQWLLALDFVEYGGTGFFEDGGAWLPDAIEHHMPYYDIYAEYVKHQLDAGHKRVTYADYLDYSIGFTSRGCFRKCSFCVNKKYDHPFLHSPVSEFVDQDRPFIYLWDDNILALPQWEKVINDIEATNKPFQFRQGIDLRLMTDQKAKRFVNAKYHGDFIFAFDHIEDKALIIDKVQLWKRYSSKICKMYVISAYKSQDESDIVDVFERIHTLMKYGSLPYIMRYEAYKTSPYKNMYIELARWCNQPNFFKKKSFREFCVANQEYKKDKSTNCAAYQAMIDFEKTFPDIADKYFDLRFDQENYYSLQYGYGRKYANKPLCKDCRKRGICWDLFVNGKCEDDVVLQAYFTKEIDLECLRYKTAECNVSSLAVAKVLSEKILKYPVERIVELIKNSGSKESVTKENVPQFSDLKDGFINVPQILNDSESFLSFDLLGYYLTRNRPGYAQDTVAYRKYGENHAKLAALADLVVIDKVGVKANVRLSQFGTYYCQLPDAVKKKLFLKLCLRIPVLQEYLPENKLNEKMAILSEKTLIRRGSNVKNMIELVHKGYSSTV